jgi:chemotaxis methyl-accepting protein methylase
MSLTQETIAGPAPAVMPASGLMVQFLRDAIAQRYGFCVNDSWSGQLDTRLAARAAATGRASVADYVVWLLGPDCDRGEMQLLVESLLIGETHFLRTEPHFAALTGKVVAAWRSCHQRGQRLRVASLGCSTGEETYSIALVLNECLSEEEMADVEITGVDVNAKALAAARRGSYEDFQLRDLSPAQRVRWFRREGARWLIHPTLRSKVRFLQHNLLEPLPFAGLDVIFCRNVLIYFQPPSVAFCFREFHSALRPGGHLFLGHAESAFGFPELFEPVQVRDGVIYQNKPILS